MSRKITPFLFLAFFSIQMFAQVYLLDSSVNNSTINTCSGTFYDNGGSTGNYSSNKNYTVTFCRNTSQPNYSYSFAFDASFSIHQGDTLFIYDGPNTSSPLLNIGPLSLPYANNSNSLANYTIRPSLSNTSGCLTFRFISENHTATGWKAQISCNPICQNYTVSIDSTLYKVINGTRIPVRVRSGQIDYIRNQFGVITDTVSFSSVDICKSDSIVVLAKTNYINNNQYYHQSDSTSLFLWKFGDNTSANIHGNREVSHFYSTSDGYDLHLTISDSFGCISNSDTVRVRIAWNPIHSIPQIPDICIETPLSLSVGYAGGNNIVVDSIRVALERRERTDTVFIPDGPNCQAQGNCFNTKLTFEHYPDRVIQSGSDICSVCLNIEHSYAGDLAMYLICPTGRRSVLMTYGGGPDPPAGVPRGHCNGSAQFGITNRSNDNGCLPQNNPQGTPWMYCWSEKYLTETQGTICSQISQSRLDSTHYAGRRKFYLPDSSFNSLIGCPINGEWMIQVCDYFGMDNGWTFGWSMEFCDISKTNWSYQVPIDSIIWNGPFIQDTGQTSVQIYPTSSGTFLYEAIIVDSFGCHWDTIVPVTVLPDLSVNLGNDTILCPNKSLQLNATNTQPNVKYIWDNGTVSPLRIVNSEGNYWASIYRQQCPQRKASDTIQVLYFEPISVNLRNDTTICYPDSIQLNATPHQQGHFTYQWSTGSTDSTIFVSNEGNFIAVVARTECPSQLVSDTVHILQYTSFSVNLGNDTTICSADSLLLSAAQLNGNFTYLWNNGNVNPTTFASKEGQYWVKVNRSECPNTILSDTLTLSNYPKLNINLGDDDFLCEAASKLLDATQTPGSNAFYQWQDSSKGTTYTVWGQGQYWVSVYNICEKKGDTINITRLTPPSLDFLPDDTSFCLNRFISITPDIEYPNYYTYKWSDGVTTSNRLINKDGMYYLEIKNKCFTLMDSIMVIGKECDPIISLPNAFTPGETTNSYFSIIKNKNIKDFQIWIYNRWGQEIFYSENLDFKWNGKGKNGVELPQSAYVYTIQYTTIQEPGIILQMKGVVNLIR